MTLKNRDTIVLVKGWTLTETLPIRQNIKQPINQYMIIVRLYLTIRFYSKQTCSRVQL